MGWCKVRGCPDLRGSGAAEHRRGERGCGREVPMSRPLTTDDLVRELRRVTSAADARAMVNRASRVAGVAPGRALGVTEVGLVCRALAEEGGRVQALVEQIARTAATESGGREP